LDGVEEFKWHLDNPPEETDAMKLGSAVHLLLLQPERANLVAFIPKFDGRTKEGKLLKQEYEEKYPAHTYILLSIEMFQKAHAMVDSIRQNSDAMQIVNSCEAFEQEYEFNYRGIPFKCKPDGIGSNFLLDLKTTSIPNKEWKIKNEINDRAYHFQAATYLRGAEKENYYIIFVRSVAPYAVFPVKLSLETINQGYVLLNEACEIYKECLRTNPEFKPNNRLRII
jgi:hypothetical protein